MTFVGEINEFDLIRRLLAVLGSQPWSVGLGTEMRLLAGDDCAAAIPATRMAALYTTDTMVEHIHFLPTMPPADLGWKSLATNISDIAGMAGIPTSALVTLAMPPNCRVEWLEDWYRGMRDCAATFNVAIAGGDIVRTHSDLCITVSLAGEVEPELLARRDGARPGDAVLVTGTLGDSAAGLALYQKLGSQGIAGDAGFSKLLDAHLRPMPRVPEARAAAAAAHVHAMMDLSDGLGGDLRHICTASGVGARLWENSLPFSSGIQCAAALLNANSTHWAISGGEDYELLLCVAPADVESVVHAIGEIGRTFATVIGEVRPEGEGLQITGEDGRERPLETSFTHF